MSKLPLRRVAVPVAVLCACGLVASCSSADSQATSDPAATCDNGAVPSDGCTCGSAVVTSGYCCSGVAQSAACSSPPSTPACGNGAVPASGCTCGSTRVTTGYCCSGVAQSAACSSPPSTPACGNGAVPASGCACGSAQVTSGYCCGGVAQSGACVTTGAIIADHNATAAFGRIPSRYLEAAKALTLHYAHTSHGSQITSGLEVLRTRDSTYAFAVRQSSSEGLPAAQNPIALRIYDGNPSDTYVTPELYWATEDGKGYTRAVARTGNYRHSMWSWCGQQSSNSQATVQQYLQTMSGFESEFPSMRFILMTGHTDGSNTPNTPNTLKYNNRLVREYAQSHNMVLYDFEDVESWDPAGTNHPTTTDACEWCSDWCSAHPQDCANLVSCVHSHGFNCVQKAKAFWWMMARLAGWDGN